MSDPNPARGSGAFGDLLQNIGLTDATPVEKLPPSRKEKLEGDDLEQLIVVNAGFMIYSWKGFDWAPPDGVVQVWLTATFVQIVSVVVVITKSLFPGGKAEDAS